MWVKEVTSTATPSGLLASASVEKPIALGSVESVGQVQGERLPQSSAFMYMLVPTEGSAAQAHGHRIQGQEPCRRKHGCLPSPACKHENSYAKIIAVEFFISFP